MVSSPSQSPSKTGISRRTVTTGLAWSVPAIVLAAPAAAVTASQPQIALVNTATLSDYHGANSIDSLGGSERFYDYGVSYTQSTNASAACSTIQNGGTSDTTDFRYRLRVKNSGTTPVDATTQENAIKITFRYPVSGPFLATSYQDGMAVLSGLKLVDPATNGAGIMQYTFTESSQYQAEFASTGHQATYVDVEISIWGVVLQADEWVQISPDWTLSDDVIGWTKDRQPAKKPIFFAWLTDFDTQSKAATTTSSVLSKRSYNSQDTTSGAWSFDGGIDRPYGYVGNDGTAQTCVAI